VAAGYRELGRAIRAAELDALVIIANDHLLNFPVTAYPDFGFGLAEVHAGPDEWFRPWLRVPEYRMTGHPAVGGNIYRGLTRRGWRANAVTDAMRFDDNISVPVTMCELTETTLPIIPVVQNCTVPPVPDERRTYAWGQALGEVIRDELGDDVRLGLLGSGGMSHEPGGAGYLKIDEQFDRRFLELLVEGDHERVLSEATLDAMEAAGSGGTSELLSWMAVMGAIGERPCEVLCYEPVVEWRCGIGAVTWEV
jgi:aromatic ring-opening dioxygenase catalytic subunit (LigB family)